MAAEQHEAAGDLVVQEIGSAGARRAAAPGARCATRAAVARGPGRSPGQRGKTREGHGGLAARRLSISASTCAAEEDREAVSHSQTSITITADREPHAAP